MQSRFLFLSMITSIVVSIAAVSLISFAAYAQAPGYTSTAQGTSVPAYMSHTSKTAVATATPSPNPGYYSSQTIRSNPGYYSGNGPSTVVYSRAHRPHHHHRTVIVPEFSVGVIRGGDTYFVPALPPGPVWVNSRYGIPIPPDAVIGGSSQNNIFYVCRAYFQGGQHPGKLVAGRCNISFGGQEIAVRHYQVLLSQFPLAWSAASYGYVPPNGLTGGHESNGKPLYICQAQFNAGMYPGKLVDRRCHIAWGGREIAVPYYNILVV